MISAKLYAGPRDGDLVAVNDVQSVIQIKLPQPPPVDVLADGTVENAKPLEVIVGTYEREGEVDSWGFVKFVWKGWS